MPIAIPAAAFSRFMTDAVTVTARARPDGSALIEKAVEIAAASVSDPATDPLQVGTAPSAWKWTIEFPRVSWTADIPPAPGATIEAGARWPSLYVEQAFPLGELWHIVCSSREVTP